MLSSTRRGLSPAVVEVFEDPANSSTRYTITRRDADRDELLSWTVTPTTEELAKDHPKPYIQRALVKGDNALVAAANVLREADGLQPVVRGPGKFWSDALRPQTPPRDPDEPAFGAGILQQLEQGTISPDYAKKLFEISPMDVPGLTINKARQEGKTSLFDQVLRQAAIAVEESIFNGVLGDDIASDDIAPDPRPGPLVRKEEADAKRKAWMDSLKPSRGELFRNITNT